MEVDAPETVDAADTDQQETEVDGPGDDIVLGDDDMEDDDLGK